MMERKKENYLEIINELKGTKFKKPKIEVDSKSFIEEEHPPTP